LVQLSELVLRPIGFIRTPFRERVEAPRQPRAATGVPGTIELLPGQGFEDALADLEGWQYIWVVFWFDRNQGWRPKVLPPRSTRRRGVFSTRTPHRPNPIGLSVLGLERVEGRVLHVRDVDLLDGTPVLDIKPYVPWTDAIPEARAGWLHDEHPGPTSLPRAEGTSADDADRPVDPLGHWEVSFAPSAAEQLVFLREAGVDLEPRTRQVLALGPHPHAYRRIRLDGDTGTLSVKDWRVRFRVTTPARRIEVFAVTTGYRPGQLVDEAPERAVHRAFVARFGES
jgi:tRNA-Thr(GGU) m(6)t(6)A37 methyltransferase TsaA